MNFFEESEEYTPITWIGGYPIYSALFLVGFHLLTLVIMSLAMAFDYGIILQTHVWYFLPYILQGRVWQLISYPYFEQPQLWFLWNMALLWTFGTQTERMIGRKKFLLLYVTLIVIPILILFLVGLVAGGHFAIYGGAFALEMGVFAAFATLYPGAELGWFNISVRVMFWAVFAMATLMHLASQQPAALLMTWTSCGVAYLYVKALGFQGGLPWLENLQDKFQERKLLKQAEARNIRLLKDQEQTASMDAILDKISREGIGSLTPDERAALEKARVELIKKEQGKG